jgi:hypothetical protein
MESNRRPVRLEGINPTHVQISDKLPNGLEVSATVRAPAPGRGYHSWTLHGRACWRRQAWLQLDRGPPCQPLNLFGFVIRGNVVVKVDISGVHAVPFGSNSSSSTLQGSYLLYRTSLPLFPHGET